MLSFDGSQAVSKPRAAIMNNICFFISLSLLRKVFLLYCTKCNLSLRHLLESCRCIVASSIATIMRCVCVGITAIVDGLSLLLSQCCCSDMPTADIIPADTLAGQLPTALVL